MSQPNEIEFAPLARTSAGAYVVHLPWRQYAGVLVDAAAIGRARERVANLIEKVQDTGADVAELEWVLASFGEHLKTIASVTELLMEAPRRGPAEAVCIRPYLAAKTPDGDVRAVLHLDTIASYRSAARATGASQSGREELDLLSELQSWAAWLKEGAPTGRLAHPPAD